MEEVLRVSDRGVVLEIGFRDLVKYHGRFYIGGVALAFKLMQLAFQELVPGGVPDRELIGFATGLGLNGPGVIDAVEMATRAKTRGRLATTIAALDEKPGPEAPDGAGRYYFEFTYGPKTIGLGVKPKLIPEEFMALSRKVHAQTISEAEKARLQEVKEELAAALLAAAPEELFIVHK